MAIVFVVNEVREHDTDLAAAVEAAIIQHASHLPGPLSCRILISEGGFRIQLERPGWVKSLPAVGLPPMPGELDHAFSAIALNAR
jgi:hypothetical protein